jgi:hypothetical protein
MSSLSKLKRRPATATWFAPMFTFRATARVRFPVVLGASDALVRPEGTDTYYHNAAQPSRLASMNGRVRTERPVNNDQHHAGEKEMNSSHWSA